MLEQGKIQELPEVQVTERIQEQIVPERNEEQIGDIPVPPFVDETVEVVVQVIPHERVHPRELFPEHFVTSGPSTFPSLRL